MEKPLRPPAVPCSKPRKQPRSVTVTYGAVSGALVVVVATVALIVKPPSPPALAEFAPQAESTIEESADNQSSRFGSGGNGACTAGQVGCEGFGTPPTTAPPVGGDDEDGLGGPDGPPAGSVRRCVGEPPRQIEDPQSPPCVNFWKGDNGGATSKGVTRDEIRVAVPRGGYIMTEDLRSLAEFFNHRFEFYGRRLTLVETKESGYTPQVQRAAAESAAEARVFAMIDETQQSSMLPFRTRLAQLGVVSVMPNADTVTEAELRELHPYAWEYSLSFDRLAQDLVEFACGSLAGRRAEYGGADVRDKERSFAVLVEDADGLYYGDLLPVADGLRSCGAPVSTHQYDADADAATAVVEQRRLVEELQGRGVTTVIKPLGGMVETMRRASEIGYQPEWVWPGGGSRGQFDDGAGQLLPPEQAAHLFAVGGWNKNLPSGDRPARWAYDEVGLTYPEGYASHADFWYRGLLVLASGIQAAGPNLTPETFARGLQGLRFPNPGAGAAPYFQASVGFTGDHTMVDDETVQWWSATAPSRYGGSPRGGWCYVDRGARWRTGRWPRLPADALFNPSKPCQ